MGNGELGIGNWELGEEDKESDGEKTFYLPYL
jgi:hypothetical protein